MTAGSPGEPMDDELARAEVYGLLAALFQAAPSPDLYAQLQVAATQAPVAGAFLEHSFSELVAASRRLPLDAVRAEYATLFEAIGKPEVFLYASYFVTGALNDKPLVVLRDVLRALGIERDPMIVETEDHIACLCEVMRYLIAGDELALGDLATQKHFFDTQVRPWADALWDALEAHPKSDFYRALASFARAFFSVEAQAFDMLEG
ncbi:MAG: molecular chaperone TorD family protein [Burkholderiaceae bacterium]|nr:molecular chaperone TorD family protein [Burkholderiaceae bacterium]